ncbi:unnamed protein product [marine sediment metagenome]|uniref:HTH marR-type domain-containing protein n=1 Tax=marine sediment metagenome TaxID=412755 RepID=X1UF54_9ZZZZ
MRVKRISDLAFQTLDKLTDDEDALWVSHLVCDGHNRTGDIQRLMKRDCCVSYDSVQRTLKTLVEKEIIIRARVGFYEPNLKMILGKMLTELQEAEDQ